MWARVIEVMLGCWLALSPFIFRHVPEDRVLWLNDLFSALVVIVVALVSFWGPLRFAHVANLAVIDRYCIVNCLSKMSARLRVNDLTRDE